MNCHSLLLAEDDFDVAQILRYRLEQCGFAVEHVARGVDALAACRTRSFDVIILDVMLPGLTGIALCRLLRDTPEYAVVPVIVVSAMSDDLTRRQATAAGADLFLPKHGFLKDIVVAAQKCVTHRKQSGNTQPSSCL